MSALIRALAPQTGGGQQKGVVAALFGKDRQQQQAPAQQSEAPPDVGASNQPQDYLPDGQRVSKSSNPVPNLFKPQLRLQ